MKKYSLCSKRKLRKTFGLRRSKASSCNAFKQSVTKWVETCEQILYFLRDTQKNDSNL